MRIKVFVRVKPGVDKEGQIRVEGDQIVYQQEEGSYLESQRRVVFGFDDVLVGKSQLEIFSQISQPLVNHVVNGFNATLIAYGQTGSGKTYTMIGGEGQERGILPRSVSLLFNLLKSNQRKFQLEVSCIEIYNEKMKDLLGKNEVIEIIKKDDQNHLQGALKITINKIEDMINLVNFAAKNRQKVKTEMNANSSRSHLLFFFYLSQHQESGVTLKSVLCMVDLAGSEKIKKTKVEGQSLTEAKNINKSLTELGRVILQLSEDQERYVNFRNSKLTRLLKNSIGGNSHTALVINASQEDDNVQETLSSLRFGQRVQKIKNEPFQVKEFSVEELMDQLEKMKLENEQLRLENQKLKKQDHQEPLMSNLSIQTEDQIYFLEQKILEQKRYILENKQTTKCMIELFLAVGNRFGKELRKLEKKISLLKERLPAKFKSLKLDQFLASFGKSQNSHQKVQISPKNLNLTFSKVQNLKTIEEEVEDIKNLQLSNSFSKDMSLGQSQLKQSKMFKIVKDLQRELAQIKRNGVQCVHQDQSLNKNLSTFQNANLLLSQIDLFDSKEVSSKKVKKNKKFKISKMRLIFQKKQEIPSRKFYQDTIRQFYQYIVKYKGIIEQQDRQIGTLLGKFGIQEKKSCECQNRSTLDTSKILEYLKREVELKEESKKVIKMLKMSQKELL